MASTIGVYGGLAAADALRDDLSLPMTSGHVIPAIKRYRAVATRYEKLAVRYEATIQVAIILDWKPEFSNAA